MRCSPPFHKFRSPDWWFGHTKNRKRQWRNWNCMSSSHHKLHETYGRCGCKWSEMRLLWCRPIFKKMVEIYIKFCPKCVSCELFHLIWPNKSSPLYSTWKQATDLQMKLGASADWYIHVSQAYKAGREVRLSELHSLTFSILYKKYQAMQKRVLCV